MTHVLAVSIAFAAGTLFGCYKNREWSMLIPGVAGPVCFLLLRF